MKFLVLDTSSKIGTIAALENHQDEQPKLISEWTLNVDTSFHSERLLWGIHHVLEASKWKISNIDCIGVGIGPGSFTGLRIGVTTARSFGKVLNIPLVGISSLCALAYPVALFLDGLLESQKSKPLIFVSINAFKGQLFGLCLTPKKMLRSIVSDKEKVLHPEEWIKHIRYEVKKNKAKDWVSVGEGAEQYEKIFRKKTLMPFLNFIQGKYLGLLAWKGYQSGLAKDALDVYPKYLRVSDAEIKLKAGLLPKTLSIFE